MAQISVEFDLPLPNQFLIDHSFTEGKTRKYTYHGPDKVYLQIGEDGTEKYGPLTAEDIADGRPMPADVVEWFEVDCTENPLACQLRAPIVNDLQEDYTGEEFHPGSPEVEGYDRYSYPTPLMPADIFDKLNVKVVDGKVEISVYSPQQKLHGIERDLTWDDIRSHRDMMLGLSDGQISTDMPESLQQEWKEYRQKLRDLPAVMENAGVDPNLAYYMFPEQPSSAKIAGRDI